MRVDVLTGEQVELRPWSPADAGWYVDARDELVYTWTTEHPATTADEVEAAINSSAADETVAAFAIWNRGGDGGGDLVGNLAVVFDGDEADVSYFLSAAGRGRGLATEAVRLACAWIIGRGLADRITATVAEGNRSSEAVLERANFVRTATSEHPVLGASSRWVLAAGSVDGSSPRATGPGH